MTTAHPPRELGTQAEAAAAQYLRRKGYVILNQNFHTRRGELDIVALDADCLTFIEVKAESSPKEFNPLLRVNEKKCHKMGLTALEYIQNKHLNVNQIRFDVLALTLQQNGEWKINHIKSAFQLEGI